VAEAELVAPAYVIVRVYVPGGVVASAEQTSVPPDGVHVRRVADVGIVKVPPLSVVMSTTVVPDVAVKVKGGAVPDCLTVADMGVTARVAPVRITVAEAVALRAWALALIPAFPGLTPVRTPVVVPIVATAVVSLDQLTPLVTTLRVPSS
jgi:hypothetical protein